MKAKTQRLIFITVSVLLGCISTVLVMSAFRENLVFFYSPSEIAEKKYQPGHPVRVGGLVESGSLSEGLEGNGMFDITDGKATLRIAYQGLLPNLFREGQGVVAEGVMQADGTLKATRVLAKHDETYMPREVVDSLKKTGHWHPNP